MALVNQADTAALAIAQGVLAILAIRPERSPTEAAALVALERATHALNAWRKDTTESSRRRAYGAAQAVMALTDPDLFACTAFSRALNSLALAVELTVEGKAAAAIRLAAGFKARAYIAAKMDARAVAWVD